MANTSAWKDYLVVLYYKVYDSTTNAISFLAIESLTLLSYAELLYRISWQVCILIPMQKSVPKYSLYLSTSLSKVLKNKRWRLIGRYNFTTVLRLRLRINTTLVIHQAYAGSEESTKKCI